MDHRRLRQRGAPGARLYYATMTSEWAEVRPRTNQFNVFMEEGTPPVTPHEELAIDFELAPTSWN